MLGRAQTIAEGSLKPVSLRHPRVFRYQRSRPRAPTELLALILSQRPGVQPCACDPHATQVLVKAVQQFAVAPPNRPARRIDDTAPVTHRVVVGLGALIGRGLRQKEAVVLTDQGRRLVRTNGTGSEFAPILGGRRGDAYGMNRIRRAGLVLDSRGILVQETGHPPENEAVVLSTLGEKIDFLVEPREGPFQ